MLKNASILHIFYEISLGSEQLQKTIGGKYDGRGKEKKQGRGRQKEIN
jgi:hypothetical protein